MKYNSKIASRRRRPKNGITYREFELLDFSLSHWVTYKGMFDLMRVNLKKVIQR